MKLSSKTSLANNAALTIAVYLWYHIDLWRLFTHDLRTLIQEVLCKMGTLPVPTRIKLCVESCVGPLGNYVFRWLHMQVHDRRFALEKVNLPKVLCWTAGGTIDNERTAQKILSTGILDTISAFRLACSSCLEEEVIKLWSQQACTCILTPYDLTEMFISSEREEEIFWICCLINKLEEWVIYVSEGTAEPRSEFSAVGFESGIRSNNKEFISYFFRKFYQTKDVKVILDCAELIVIDRDSESDPELFFQFFSRMDENERLVLFRKYPLDTLLIFVEWPLTSFFLDVAEQVYNFMSNFEFYLVLEVLSSYLFAFVDNLALRYIFEEFWNKSPDNFKNFFIYECVHKYLQKTLESAQRDTRKLAKLVNIPEELCKPMYSNAIIILDILSDFCCWNILETLILKYTSRTPITLDFLKNIRIEKSKHTCGKFCSRSYIYYFIRSVFRSEFDSEDTFMDFSGTDSETDFSESYVGSP